MVHSVFLTKNAFVFVVKNLLEIEEGINQLNDYFPTDYKGADEVKRVLKDYITQCDVIIQNTFTLETASNDFPYAIIGSEVIVKDTQSLEKLHYRLVSPFTKKQIASEDISCLSPMGKALLLKQLYDEVHVKAPGGEFTYRIISIKINADCLNCGGSNPRL